MGVLTRTKNCSSLGHDELGGEDIPTQTWTGLNLVLKTRVLVHGLLKQWSEQTNTSSHLSHLRLVTLPLPSTQKPISRLLCRPTSFPWWLSTHMTSSSLTPTDMSVFSTIILNSVYYFLSQLCSAGKSSEASFAGAACRAQQISNFRGQN